MTIPNNEKEKDSSTRTGGNIETRESAPVRPISGNDDPERTGGNIETREGTSQPPLSSGDDDPERGSSAD